MDEARWMNLGNARESYISGDAQPACLPHEAFIEVSARCNLRCRMCAINYDSRYQSGSNRPAMLEPETFHRLEPIFPKLVKAYLYGLGEPVMNRHLIDYISTLADAGVEPWFTTNATLIDRTFADRVARAGAHRVSVSLDGITRETYEAIRLGGRFEDAIGGLEALCKARRTHGNPMVTVNFVAMGSNLHELDTLVKRVIDMGVGEINVESLFAWQTEEQLEHQYAEDSLAVVDRAWAQDVIDGAASSAAAAGVHFSSYLVATEGALDYAQRVAEQDRPHARCGEPWGTIFVTTAGEVRPCCLNDRVMGLLAESPIEGIWCGSAYAEFRDCHRMGQLPVGCESCAANGRTKISPHLDAVKAVVCRPFSLQPEPEAIAGWALSSPSEGESTTDPLTITGTTPAGAYGSIPEIAIDGVRVAQTGDAQFADGRFTLRLEVPYLTEGVHLMSLVGESDAAPGWSRRAFRHRSAT